MQAVGDDIDVRLQCKKASRRAVSLRPDRPSHRLQRRSRKTTAFTSCHGIQPQQGGARKTLRRDGFSAANHCDKINRQRLDVRHLIRQPQSPAAEVQPRGSERHVSSNGERFPRPAAEDNGLISCNRKPELYPSSCFELYHTVTDSNTS